MATFTLSLQFSHAVFDPVGPVVSGIALREGHPSKDSNQTRNVDVGQKRKMTSNASGGDTVNASQPTQESPGVVRTEFAHFSAAQHPLWSVRKRQDDTIAVIVNLPCVDPAHLEIWLDPETSTLNVEGSYVLDDFKDPAIVAAVSGSIQLKPYRVALPDAVRIDTWRGCPCVHFNVISRPQPVRDTVWVSIRCLHGVRSRPDACHVIL